MSTKERILELVRQMPDTATFDEILERIQLIEYLQLAVREIERGEGVELEAAKRQILSM